MSLLKLAQSTPQKIKSSRAQTHTSSSLPDSRPQSDLKSLVAAEIKNQTYQFDPDVVARMLSPKLRRDPKSASPPFLDEFHCLIDDPVVESALQQLPKLDSVTFSPSENANYDPIAVFLNQCVEGCDSAYDHIHETLSRAKNSLFKLVKRADRWFPSQFHFVVYDKSTKDGIQNASPLKPDLVGIDYTNMSSSTEVMAWWGLPPAPPPGTGGSDQTNRRQILIPVEIKASWRELVMQSGTYARGQFSANPLRSFTVVIAVSHTKQDLRYLIFHHGGLSASIRLKINDTTDSAAIRKIMLSILLWQSVEDAGLPSFTDGQNFCLPMLSPGTSNIRRCIYHSLSIRGRNTYVVKLETSQVESSQNPAPPQGPTHQFQRTTTIIQGTKRERTNSRLAVTDTSSISSQSGPSSKKQRRVNTTKVKTGVAKVELEFEPILSRERPRPLTAVLPSRVIRKTLTPLPPTVIVKCSWPNSAKEEMEPRMYKACEDRFGAPDAIISFQACFRKGHPMSNAIFLPKVNEDIDNCHWDLFKHGKPHAAEYRTLWVIVLADEGQTLDECLNASDLSECILHSMLGWLSAYQCGYLHRDVSVGNLLKLPKTTSRKPFNVWEVANLLYQLLPLEQQKEFGELSSLSLDKGTASSLTFNNSECEELVKTAAELETLVHRLGLTTECKATFTDGDMATYIPNYFKKDSVHNQGTISGTVEFMSMLLLNALESKKPYLQSPLDDLWSFFWTALWATLYNHFDPGKSNDEKEWREKLRDRKLRDSVANIVRNDPTIERNEEYSFMLRQMVPLLRKWYRLLDDMTYDLALAKIRVQEKGNAEVDYLMLFHKTAYTGVLEFVRLLSSSNLLQ